MEHVRVDVPPQEAGGDACEERVAPRFTLLIRSANLVAPQGEFIVVIRDVSSTGISLRGFHPLPSAGPLRLELQTGESHAIEQVWQRGNEAGFRFVEAVQVHDLVAEAGRFPKRQLRLNVTFPVTIATGGQLVRGELTNLSQQGARIDCSALFAIAQPLRIQSRNLPDIVARVRWRRVDTYGVVFDTTFSLKQLALFATGLQAPELLAEPPCAVALRQGA
ncbi:MAG: PilZ domain-containing protein [Tsuneonella sp.]